MSIVNQILARAIVNFALDCVFEFPEQKLAETTPHDNVKAEIPTS